MALPYAKIILSHLTAELKARGFRQHGQTFIRQIDDCFQLVNLQASQFGAREDQRYTLNLGVYCDRVQLREKEVARLKEYECHWNARIGSFAQDRRDRWWVVRSDADAEIAGIEMAEALAIPLEAMDAISTYETLIRIPPGPGVTSDDPPGSCRWSLINEAREREGLPPSVCFEYEDGYRNAWHRRQYPVEGVASL